jgi:hypothetical protein
MKKVRTGLRPSLVNALRHLEAVRQCAGKHRHESRGKAEAHLRGLVKRYGSHRLGVYWCKFCRGYHVGHTPKDKAVV